MKSSRKVYANTTLKGSRVTSKQHLWTVVFIDRDGIEKSQLAYSYQVPTLSDARQFCHHSATKVYPYTGHVDIDKCDWYMPVFMDAHRSG